MSPKEKGSGLTARRDGHFSFLGDVMDDQSTLFDTGPSRPPFNLLESWRLWYAHYPRKEAPRKAETAYSKAIARITKTTKCEHESAEVLLQAVLEFKMFWVKGRTRTLCPMPATWLNQDRWDDDRELWKEGMLAWKKESGVPDYDKRAKNEEARIKRAKETQKRQKDIAAERTKLQDNFVSSKEISRRMTRRKETYDEAEAAILLELSQHEDHSDRDNGNTD